MNKVPKIAKVFVSYTCKLENIFFKNIVQGTKIIRQLHVKSSICARMLA